MTTVELAMVVVAVLGAAALVALTVILMRVRDTIGVLEGELDRFRTESTMVMQQLEQSTRLAQSVMETAQTDLERFDRVIGSAEAISDAMNGTGRVAKTALSAPAIKAAGIASGTRAAVRKLRGKSHASTVVALDSPKTGRPPYQISRRAK